MTIFTADQARQLTAKSLDSGPDTQKLVTYICDKIQKAALAGKSSVYYPFDGFAELGQPDKAMRDAVRKNIEAMGYKWNYQATQDPGHPCDRPIDTISW